MKRIKCESYNVVYMLEFNVSTIHQLKHRVADRRGFISSQVTSRVAEPHWNVSGHSLAHLKVTVLEQSRSTNSIMFESITMRDGEV